MAGRAVRSRIGLVDALGEWTSGPGPLHRQLADAIQDAIARDEIGAGEALPPERLLAHSLGVSRTTVGNAYTLLKEAGWLESRQGSKTWARRRDGIATDGNGDPISSLRGNAFLRPERLATIDLATAALRPPPLLTEVVHTVVEEDLETLLEGHGYHPTGLGQLRMGIAQRFAAQGIPTTERQILVTTGAQQAIALLAAHYLQDGDLVVTEALTSPGALDAFRHVGARFRTLPVDSDGAETEALQRLLARTAARLVYMMPTFHNPTGTVMAAQRRQRVADLAREQQITVIDDMSHADLVLDDPPPPPLAAYDAAGSIVTIGSMSKLFWGGLRIGWIRAPESVISQLLRLKAVFDLGTPLLSQLVAARLLPRTAEAQAFRRAELLPLREQLLALLHQCLPSWSCRPPRGGVSVWVQLPEGKGDDFGQIASRHGVLVVPGSLLSPDGQHHDGLRLSFGLRPGILQAGVMRLAEAWQVYQRLLRSGRSHDRVVLI